MAILRRELQGKGTVLHREKQDGSKESVTVGVYDAIAEAQADLSSDQAVEYAPGSMVYCLQEDSLHIKTTAGIWTEVCL